MSESFTKKSDGKSKIARALGAIVILALSFTVFQKINPETMAVRFKPLHDGERIALPMVSFSNTSVKDDFVQTFNCLNDGTPALEQNCDEYPKPT